MLRLDNQEKQSDKQIISFAEEHSLALSPAAVKLLSTVDNWKEILEELQTEGLFFVDSKDLEKKLVKTKFSQAVEVEVIQKTRFSAQAKERPANYKIMDEYNVDDQTNVQGKVGDFLRLFRSKFDLLSSMLKERHNLNPITIANLKKVSKNENVDLIGMVNKKWVTKNQHVAFEVEDLEAKCVVLIMNKEKELMNRGEHVLEDNVVGIKGVKIGDDFIIIKDIFWPDLPNRPMKTINEEVLIGGISDLHIGSALFYEEAFTKFLGYINGNGLTGKDLERVGKIQYLFVSGDNVAGVGVYPGQFDELLIKDLYAQYKKFEDLMLQIPEYIQVFICPGQHDAVRRAEPQPAVPNEFVPRLSKLKNFHFVSSPSWIEVEGFKNLMYHGASIHDLISSVSFLEMSKPQDGMVELLKKRDLMPKYGGKNPYVPERKDYMVVKEVPDIVWIGDMHHNGYANYRCTTVINSGTWEAQTDFQRKMGHAPTPGIFTTLNLKDRSITEHNFLRRENK